MARQINEWERARRDVQFSDLRIDPHEASVTVRSKTDLIDATVLWLSPGNTGEQMWGFHFAATIQTIRGNTECIFRTTLESA